MSRDEDGLFRKLVYHDQDGCEARGEGELLDEIHRNGVPWLLWDRELLEQSIRSMA